MASHLLRNKFFRLILQCVSLSSPEGRIVAFGAGMIILAILPPPSHFLPDLCIIKESIGYCPACGTTRALACFFKCRFLEAINYNTNVVLVGPLIFMIFLKDFIIVMKKNIVMKGWAGVVHGK